MLEWLAGMTVIFHELLVVISWDSIGILMDYHLICSVGMDNHHF
jgi:hypothetical protein